MVEEKSLKITGANKTFFNKLTTTLNKFLIPTRVGLNGLLISAKRNNLIKAYDRFSEEKYEPDEKNGRSFVNARINAKPRSVQRGP